jgi:uncharacterized protein YgbK (DUF1537 family)
MIVVIADDLSGAAELAGAAVRHGLGAEVQTLFDPASDADVVCVDTDSRLLAPAIAGERVAEVARRVVAAKPAWIFKKCDSVLRGPVLAEARAVAAIAGRSQIIIVPANPSRQRTICDGFYRIAGQPLHETVFAHDPTHPRLTSNVAELLGGDLAHVAVPDATIVSDVQNHAALVDAATLPVGAVDFFTALLTRHVSPKTPSAPPVRIAGSALLVCGSETAWPQRQSEAAALGTPTFALPHDLPAAISALRRGQRVMIAIGDGAATHHFAPPTLTAQLAQSVTAILRGTRVENLLLEGGATSAAVIAALGWTRLRAEPAADSGVGILRPVAAGAPLLVIKPGSYPWPVALWP